LSKELGYTVITSEMLESLTSDWLKDRDIPVELVEKARMREFEKERLQLLRDFNDFWYLAGHKEVNIERVKKIYDDLSPEDKAHADSLLERYNDLHKKWQELKNVQIKPEVRDRLEREKNRKEMEEILKRIEGIILTEPEKKELKELEEKYSHLEKKQERLCEKFNYDFMSDEKMPKQMKEPYKKFEKQMEKLDGKISKIYALGKRRAKLVKESMNKEIK